MSVNGLFFHVPSILWFIVSSKQIPITEKIRIGIIIAGFILYPPLMLFQNFILWISKGYESIFARQADGKGTHGAAAKNRPFHTFPALL
jgi:hypothetical protein